MNMVFSKFLGACGQARRLHDVTMPFLLFQRCILLFELFPLLLMFEFVALFLNLMQIFVTLLYSMTVTQAEVVK